MLLKRLTQLEFGFSSLASLACRFVSNLVVFNPLCIVAFRSPEGEKYFEFERRLIYYLGGSPTAKLVLKKEGAWLIFEINEKGIQRSEPCNVFVLFWYSCLGRMVIGKATRYTLLMQRILPGKVFIIDWTSRGYRNTAFRSANLVHRTNHRLLVKRWDNLNMYGDDVVVMGTGPSAEMVFEEPYRSMPLITCNTALKSKRLRQHKIAGFCVIDALYFFAPTEYARAFQETMRAVVREKSFPIFVMADQERFLLRRFPWLPAERVYGVDVSSHYRPNSNFKCSPTQKAYNSVFPIIMLPLATTFYKRIYLVGFDGKDKSTKNYFWKHSDEFQFPELIPSVKEHDPGFFDNEINFYDNHHLAYSAMISSVLSLAQSQNKEIIMTHPSFIPSLNELYLARKK